MSSKSKMGKLIALGGLVFFLVFVSCSLFWPTSLEWQKIDDSVGTVKTLGLSHSRNGSRVFAVIEFEDGTTTRTIIATGHDVRAGDRVLLSTFVNEEKPTTRKYVFSKTLSKE